MIDIIHGTVNKYEHWLAAWCVTVYIAQVRQGIGDPPVRAVDMQTHTKWDK